MLKGAHPYWFRLLSHAWRCSGGILANAAGEQSGLREGMTSSLMGVYLVPTDIVCVPDSIVSSVCGRGAHAETVAAKTTTPTQAIALFISDLLNFMDVVGVLAAHRTEIDDLIAYIEMFR